MYLYVVYTTRYNDQYTTNPGEKKEFSGDTPGLCGLPVCPLSVLNLPLWIGNLRDILAHQSGFEHL